MARQSVDALALSARWCRSELDCIVPARVPAWDVGWSSPILLGYHTVFEHVATLTHLSIIHSGA